MSASSPFRLDDSVALVTGGAGLIGKAICDQLDELGASVVVGDVDGAKAISVADSLDEPSTAVTMDISDEESLETAFEEVEEQYGGLDILVNNAYPRTETYGQPMEQVTAEQWNENLNDHLGGYFLTVKHAVNTLKKRGRASIVNMGSIYGMVGPDLSLYQNSELTNPIEYSAIKGGIINLTRYLASYLGPEDIRVNAVSPGGVYDDQPDDFVERYKAKTVLERMATPEDVAGAVCFLASDAASYITGHNLVVDGGFTIH